MNQSFLISHINRRHKDVVMGSQVSELQWRQFLDFSIHPQETQQEANQLNMERWREADESRRKSEMEAMLETMRIDMSEARGRGVTELTATVQQQQNQIRELQDLLQKPKEETSKVVDDMEGKLKAQERFWQAQIKSLEDKTKRELTEAMEELKTLKKVHEDDKRILQENTKKKRKKRREKLKKEFENLNNEETKGEIVVDVVEEVPERTHLKKDISLKAKKQPNLEKETKLYKEGIPEIKVSFLPHFNWYPKAVLIILQKLVVPYSTQARA